MPAELHKDLAAPQVYLWLSQVHPLLGRIWLIILHVPVIYLLGGLGALAAALGFMFQDPILNFIGGIQLVANEVES